jgi:predicted GIY-YIG superfamily endonuclease
MSTKIIYKFEHNENIYIGSTINLKQRVWAHNQHKKQYKHCHLDLYAYCNENNIVDLTEHISILETLPENIEKKDMRIKEQEYMTQYQPNLNMIKAYKFD